MSDDIDWVRFGVLVKQDSELAYRLSNLESATFRFQMPDYSVDVVIAQRRVTDVRPATINASVASKKPGAFTDVQPTDGVASVILDIPEGFWKNAVKNPPPPGYESLSSGGLKGLRLSGDLQSLVAPFHPVWERLFQLVGETVRGAVTRSTADTEPFKETDNAVGRYIYVVIDGIEMRVYYETAGTGPIPLLLQHTAGADSRQYRHQLADPELQRDFTMIAYDLPYHGRSLPPSSIEWWKQPYKISQQQIMSAVIAISNKLELDRPIFMGCSVGGQLALDLAAFHADKFRGFIALNGWHDMGPFESFSNDPFRNPLISPNWYSSGCYGATSPIAPEANRQETYWIYRSNFPGIYAGDNDYFMHGHDLRRDGKLIDGKTSKVYVLNGSYDASMHFDANGGEAVARNVPGVVFREMPGLSHFAPSDDPLGFRRELLPILRDIVKA